MARRRGEAEDGRRIDTLPEDCLAHVLSLTTPREACRSALVSAAFRSAASSDALWERFLPSDYPSILSRAVDPVVYASKRELYFRLCDSILVDGGNMSFSLVRSTGGKCYMISPRSMRIIWGDRQQYWSWITGANTRFGEVAVLWTACGLDIGGRIDCPLLSRRTTNAAYLVFKLAPRLHALGDPPLLASVKVGAYSSERCISLKDDDYRDQRRLRGDGWLEVELGEFYNDEGDDGDVEICLADERPLYSTRGLIIQGLEVRPKI